MLPLEWWRIAAIAGFGLLAGAAASPGGGRAASDLRLVLQHDGSRSRRLAEPVTEEFEEALGKAGCLPIVERPDLRRRRVRNLWRTRSSTRWPTADRSRWW